MNKLIAEIDSKFRSESNHTFLFHLNIDDLFPAGDGQLGTLTEILLSAPPLKDSCFVVFFNLATGIRFVDEEQEARFIQFLDQYDKGEIERFRKDRDKLGYAIYLFSKYLRKSRKDRNVKSAFSKASELSGLAGMGDEKDENKPFFSVVMEYMETIVHSESAHSSCSIDREALVAHLVWSKDRDIRRSKNLIYILGESLASVASQLRSETSEISICKVNFPDQAGREYIYNLAKSDLEALPGDLEPKVFAKSSGGMSAKGIIKLARECALDKQPVSAAILFERKKRFIEEMSGGLLEIKRPLCGIEAIGNLEKHKEYISDVVRNMKKGNWGSVPKGILLLGGPGTGKTVFAEAVSFEADIPFIVMKNTREKWVGSSERNQDFCFNLIEAQAPAVLFIDEIDQQVQNRSGMGDNTGVNQRMTARLFEFSSNTNLRGKVLFLAATNRPDLMDSALLREGRFDDRIPFFPPATAERADIVRALLYKNKVLAESQGTSFEWELSGEDILYFARRAHCHIKGSGQSLEVQKCDGEQNDHHPMGIDDNEDKEFYFTGGQIENIIRRARERASTEDVILNRNHLIWALTEDFIPGEEVASYETLTELAVNYSNSARFLPTRGRWARLSLRKGVVLPKKESTISKPKFSE